MSYKPIKTKLHFKENMNKLKKLSDAEQKSHFLKTEIHEYVAQNSSYFENIDKILGDTCDEIKQLNSFAFKVPLGLSNLVNLFLHESTILKGCPKSLSDKLNQYYHEIELAMHTYNSSIESGHIDIAIKYLKERMIEFNFKYNREINGLYGQALFDKIKL